MAANIRRSLIKCFQLVQNPPYLSTISYSQKVTRGFSTLERREERYLVTGAGGQIGQELVRTLREREGHDAVLATDIRPSDTLSYCDVTDASQLADLARLHGTTCIVHLASLLSAAAEKNPLIALRTNLDGIRNVLEVARLEKMRVFSPSSIAVFGPNPSLPRVMVPDNAPTKPTTMYGITKVHLELLGEYYRTNYDVDFRSLRYPGIVSLKNDVGGGTTDYAVEIFHAAMQEGAYKCFLKSDQKLPMMYIPDCLKATLDLIDAPRGCLSRAVYNVTSMSFSPEDLANQIKTRLPDFQIEYAPDFRQKIAETWPESIDDSCARDDFDWRPDFNMQAMTDDMLDHLLSISDYSSYTSANVSLANLF